MRDPNLWMWSEACEMLARAGRMQQQLFVLRQGEAAFEPPVDVLETEGEVLVFVALPGVDPDQVEAAIQDGALLIAGRRVLPPELRTAAIHQMELPQGRFERRVRLPAGRYSGVQTRAQHGCLLVILHKAA